MQAIALKHLHPSRRESGGGCQYFKAMAYILANFE